MLNERETRIGEDGSTEYKKDGCLYEWKVKMKREQVVFMPAEDEILSLTSTHFTGEYLGILNDDGSLYCDDADAGLPSIRTRGLSYWSSTASNFDLGTSENQETYRVHRAITTSPRHLVMCTSLADAPVGRDAKLIGSTTYYMYEVDRHLQPIV